MEGGETRDGAAERRLKEELIRPGFILNGGGGVVLRRKREVKISCNGLSGLERSLDAKWLDSF